MSRMISPGFCRSSRNPLLVVPAKAGIHNHRMLAGASDAAIGPQSANVGGYGSRIALRLSGTTAVLVSPPPNPEKASQIAALTSRSEEIPMSLSALESTVNTAFEARDGISTATKGEVRDAVDHSLELLDKGEVRVAEREANGKRSEEHTSELQSRQYLVCRLLLATKN